MVKKINKVKTVKPSWDKLYRKAYSLWKECAFLIYGAECQVKKNFPYINIIHSPILQIDHVFTRANKWLHLDIRNGVPICSSCNAAKSWKIKGIDVAIYKICENKIGSEEFGNITRVAQHSIANNEWKKIWYMDKQIETLEEIKRSLTNGKAD